MTKQHTPGPWEVHSRQPTFIRANGGKKHITVKPCKPSRAARMGRDAYAELWESINGPGSWAASPWVWVVEFRG